MDGLYRISSGVDLYSIWNMDNLYSSITHSSRELYSNVNGLYCISRSAVGIPCMHSALHSSIIAYSLRLKRARIEYSIRKGFPIVKKRF